MQAFAKWLLFNRDTHKRDGKNQKTVADVAALKPKKERKVYKMINAKIISNLDKALINGRFEDYAEISRLSALRGERISFQVLCELVTNEWGNNFSQLFTPTLSGALARYATVRQVCHVPATNNGRATPDADYMTTAPCLMPDILAPLSYCGAVVVVPYSLVSLWVDIEIPEGAPEVGESTLTVTLTSRPRDLDAPNP